MVTQEESATVSEGEGEGVAREAGRAERDWDREWDHPRQLLAIGRTLAPLKK